jgi:hypothetical protein
MSKIKRGRSTNHLTPALSPTKDCGGEGETISALVAGSRMWIIMSEWGYAGVTSLNRETLQREGGL